MDQVGRTGLPASSELQAFLLALRDVSADAATACAGWTAHDIVAHMAAGSAEMTRLVEARLAGGPAADVGPTRSFEEREPAFAALGDRALRRRFVRAGLELTDAILRLQAAGPNVTVPFTGWDMTAAELITHGRSELVLHRWDLVGSDDVSRRLLDDAGLLTHGHAVLARMGVRVSARAAAGAADDGAAEALLRLWGRDPGWAPPAGRGRSTRP
jgi:hypothetical protein